jgi:hypothetical protein
MTLHMHRADHRTWVRDGDQPLEVPAGWQIADGSADDVRVCGAHPWQSSGLVFANGRVYGTAACWNYSYRGDRSFCCSVEKFTNIYKIPNPLKLKSGRKWNDDYYLRSSKGPGVKSYYSTYDVLLRKRA